MADFRSLRELKNGPKSTRELGITPQWARWLEGKEEVVIDPDRFPDEYVPGNPMILRLPGDERPWPGWEDWNVE